MSDEFITYTEAQTRHYEQLLELERDDPEAFNRLSTVERMNTARYAQKVHGRKVYKDPGPVFQPNGQWEGILSLKGSPDYQKQIDALPASSKMAYGRYIEARKAAKYQREQV